MNLTSTVSDVWNSTDDDDDPLLVDPQYFSYRYRIVGTFFISIVFIVGVLGNAMVVLVVTRVRALNSSPTNCYLLSLAVADTVVLVAAVPNEILSYYLVGNRWIWGDAGCALFVFCQNLGINASSLSLVAFTVERYIAICHPMKAHKICTRGHAERITAVVWTFAALYCAPWLGLTKTERLHYRGYPGGVTSCVFRLPRNKYLIYFFADLVMFYVAPLLASCVLYTLISLALISRPVVSVKDPKIHLDATNSSQSSKTKVVKMLAAVVVVFAVLWLPYRGLVVYNSFITLFGGEPYMDLWFLMFAKTCVYINSAINPILYNAMSMKFRRAFHSLLRCGEPSGSGREGEYGGRLMRVSTIHTTTTTTRSSRFESSTVPTTRDTTAF